MNWRIGLAFLLGVVLVSVAFVISRNRTEFTNSIDGQPDNLPIRSFIAVTDQDKDSIPDWQNSFDISTINLDNTATYPVTKTTSLAVDLALRSLNSEESRSDETMAEIGINLAKSNLDKQYTKNDILVSEDNSSYALRNYGNQVANIAIKNAPPAGTENELMVLNRAFLHDDSETLAGLDPTIVSYEKMLEEMLNTPVPSSLVREHLSLINVYQAILNNVKAFRNVFDDALPAMTRFRRYQADAEALYWAISNLYLKLHENGIQWTKADTASRFIEIADE